MARRSKSYRSTLDLDRDVKSNTKDVFNVCFHVVAVCVRFVPSYNLTEDKARLLVGHLDWDLKQFQKQSLAFELLRALLHRKVLLPEIYDLMTQVGELVVQSLQENVQQEAASCFLVFLLDYPMKDKRLEQHFGFLCNNLSYGVESGRLAVLNLLDTIVKKFPAALLEKLSGWLVGCSISVRGEFAIEMADSFRFALLASGCTVCE